MRTVRDDAGNHYLLVKQSSETSRVRDPESGAERYVENERLELVDGVSPLVTAASAVPAPVRRVLSAVPNDRALGLLVELCDQGPLAVVDLLDRYDLCESDLHGLLAEFQAAGLVVEADVYGHRGYAPTETCRTAVALLTDR